MKLPIGTKDCLECGKTFTLSGWNHLCCSNKCVQKRTWRKNKAGTEAEKLRSADKYKRLGRTPRWRYGYYKQHAKNAGREFSISLEDFTKFVSQPCYYCGNDKTQMGIDRINNSVGYSVENSRPCCSGCNMAKGKMSEDEFINMCQTISVRFSV